MRSDFGEREAGGSRGCREDPRYVASVSSIPSKALRGPIVLVTPTGQYEHEQGELLIGRGQTAGIVIDDPLVSRNHARICTRSDGLVVVEDLNSTNGVFVNGVRMTRRIVPLQEGDRLLLGTTEISVFSARPVAELPLQAKRIGAINLVQRAPATAPNAPPVGPDPGPDPANFCHTLVDAKRESGDIAPTVPRVAATTRASRSTTERSDTVELVGRLSDRLVAAGKVKDAVRVLSEHLNSLLVGASAGLPVPANVLSLATRYGLRLYDWTHDTAWIDYTFELHVACREFPSDSSLGQLEAVCPTALGLDRHGVEFLIQVLETRLPEGRAEDEACLVRLRAIAQGARR